MNGVIGKQPPRKNSGLLGGQANGSGNHRLQGSMQPIDELVQKNRSSDGSKTQWLLWQLADSAFPTGGFAHSGGIEATFQQGELRTVADLSSFIEASLWQLGHASLPFMTSAYNDPKAAVDLDHQCDCFLNNHVANRASRLQGRALLASAQRIFGLAYEQLWHYPAAGQESFRHLAPVFGVTMRTVEVSKLQAARLFFFLHLRGLISGAVRLGIIGPLQGQALQNRLAARAEEILLRCYDLTLNEIAQTAPLLDLWQANQDRLYSRLFQS